MFLERLAGVTEPEEKRKIIGATFIDVFEAAARGVGDADFLGPGNALPGRDRIGLRQRAERRHQVPPQCRRAA